MRLQGDVDSAEATSLIEDAYRAAAPKRLLAALEVSPS